MKFFLPGLVSFALVATLTVAVPVSQSEDERFFGIVESFFKTTTASPVTTTTEAPVFPQLVENILHWLFPTTQSPQITTFESVTSSEASSTTVESVPSSEASSTTETTSSTSTTTTTTTTPTTTTTTTPSSTTETTSSTSTTTTTTTT